MNIGIHFGNHLMAEAICQLLVENGYDAVVASGRPATNGFTPGILLVDTTTLKHDLFAQYPDAKILLIDTGIEEAKLIAVLFSYRIHGVLSPHAEPPPVQGSPYGNRRREAMDRQRDGQDFAPRYQEHPTEGGE